MPHTAVYNNTLQCLKTTDHDVHITLKFLIGFDPVSNNQIDNNDTPKQISQINVSNVI